MHLRHRGGWQRRCLLGPAACGGLRAVARPHRQALLAEVQGAAAHSGARPLVAQEQRRRRAEARGCGLRRARRPLHVRGELALGASALHARAQPRDQHPHSYQPASGREGLGRGAVLAQGLGWRCADAGGRAAHQGADGEAGRRQPIPFASRRGGCRGDQKSRGGLALAAGLLCGPLALVEQRAPAALRLGVDKGRRWQGGRRGE
mmetsp:Transcript_63209/g.126754  ORF Transcript_63209/g.126754 Transcript_63209/m.126754 type:complete len:205 (-) Transcript_63209:236-850(-)